MTQFHATTICLVRRSADDIAIAGDGQVTMGEHSIMKNNAKKIRKIYEKMIEDVSSYISEEIELQTKFSKK